MKKILFPYPSEYYGAILMTKQIGLFVEDYGHETFLKALLHRYAKEYGLEIALQLRSVRGEYGRMMSELRQYLRDVQRDPAAGMLEVLIIARDANCKGVQERKREMEEEFQKRMLPVVPIYAIPDPHIERWLLLDSNAFKQVLGKGCKAPDKKCQRDRYKKLLSNAVCEAGLSPIFNGMEHAEAIVNKMDLQRVTTLDQSLGQLLQDITAIFNQWQKEKQ